MSAVLACGLVQTVSAGEHREHGAHVHGIGRLNVAFDSNTLEIELDSPAANLVGFEHAPRDPAEKTKLDQTLVLLRDGDTLFVLPAAAGCRMDDVRITREEAKDHDDDGKDHDHHDEGNGHHHGDGEEGHHHADMNVFYRFRCQNAAALSGVDVRLFEHFPATKKLHVQFIGPKGQGGRELTATDPVLRF